MTGRWGMLGIAAVLPLTTMIALSGCSAPSGHLTLGGSGTGLCSDSDTLKAITVGVPITNDGTAPVTITETGAGVTGAVDVEGPWIVPATDEDADFADLPTFVDDVPPDEEIIRWTEREGVDGSELAAGESAFIVFQLTLQDGEIPDAAISNITATYDGGARVAESKDQFFRLTPEPGTCMP